MAAFYVAAALSGMALAFFHVTAAEPAGILSRPDEHARNFSNFRLVGASTNLSARLIAGFSIDYAGHAVACLYIARAIADGNPDAGWSGAACCPAECAAIVGGTGHGPQNAGNRGGAAHACHERHIAAGH